MSLTKRLVVSVSALLTVAGACAAQCGGGKSMSSSDTQPNVVHATYAEAKDIVDTAAGNPNFSTLVSLIQSAGLVETLKGKGPFTVFAPTNDAFKKIDPKTLEALGKDKEALTRVLTYHVVPGNVLAADVTKLTFADTVSGQRAAIDTKSGVTIAGAKVTQTDIKTSNGVIHVVDSVLLPSSDNIVQTAVKAGSFKTLAKALEAAGLVSTLEGKGPFTVFAPTDEAFAKLGEKTIADLLKPENKAKLTAILTYHVVPGRVFSDQAIKAKTAKTVQGESVTIEAKGGKATVNNAGIVTTDINASNGVIHVIDTVILPQAAK